MRPHQIWWTFKEVWTAPSGQWIWLAQDISVPATVRGITDPANHDAIEFREQRSGRVIHVAVSFDGELNFRLSEGRYDVHHGAVHTSVAVLLGAIFLRDLRPEHFLDFKVTAQSSLENEVVVRLEASSAGDREFSLRSDNLAVSDPAVQNIHLTAGDKKEVGWRAHMLSAETTCVAVVIPDGEMNEHAEVTGANAPHK
jgi:hypothetical protein